MMRMIMLFVGCLFQRPFPGHGQFVRAEHRIEIRARNVFVMVFGERFAVDLDAKFVVQLGDLHRIGGMRADCQ